MPRARAVSLRGGGGHAYALARVLVAASLCAAPVPLLRAAPGGGRAFAAAGAAATADRRDARQLSTVAAAASPFIASSGRLALPFPLGTRWTGRAGVRAEGSAPPPGSNSERADEADAKLEESEAAAALPAASEDDSGSLVAQAALFLTYFSLQCGMSFYMKWILSKVQVAQDLVGVPASFLVTTTQQLVGFMLFILFVSGSRLVGRPYRPKALASRKEFLLVLGLSLSFSLNIGTNLLSLSLVPLSLTMIIRGCSPLSTALMQTLIMRKKQDISAGEWACMVFGVFCAGTVVVAQSGGPSGTANFAFLFGVAMCVISLFSAALDFVFKGVLGTNVKLNALETTCYMALPVALFTSLLGSILAKPVSGTWAARFAPRMTDLAVFGRLWQVNPAVFGWVMASGLLAFTYNTFVTFMVVKLSPATTAFAGNFNKAATILLSLVFLEGKLPPGIRGRVIVGAILANIATFTLYNVLRKRRQSRK